MLALALTLALGQTILDGTSQSLTVVTSTSAAIDYVVSYVDYTSTTVTPGVAQGAITSATTTTWVSAPAASTQRQLRRGTFRNKSTTASNVLTFRKTVSATAYEMYRASLGPGESVRVEGDGDWTLWDSAGIQRIPGISFQDGRAVSIFKAGGTGEAGGVLHSFIASSGNPGAWVPGTPGINGVNVSCNTTTDATTAGSPYLPDPSTGGYYLTNASASVAAMVVVPIVYDLLWYNTGLGITGTPNPALLMGTLPARDQEGATNGEGLSFALLVTTATGNVGAVTNITATYTNSDGTAGRSATMNSFPATAAVGTVVPFQLQAGDRGVRSIDSITFGSSLVSGAVSLIVYRPIVQIPVLTTNTGSSTMATENMGGSRVWNGSCLQLMQMPQGTTAVQAYITTTLTVR